MGKTLQFNKDQNLSIEGRNTGSQGELSSTTVQTVPAGGNTVCWKPGPGDKMAQH